MMATLLQALRYAVRTLAKSPGFTGVAVLTLALGIGANTAIFSAVNTVLLKPLPYPGSDRLVQIMSTGFRGVRFGVSFPDLRDLRALSRDFTGVAAVVSRRYNLTGAGDAREVQVAAATADLCDVLQVRPEIGHAFTAADERTPLALLSHGLWVTSFGRDPAILGKSISLDGRSFTVIGVMPAGFEFPNADVQVWTPIGEFLAQNPQAETNRGMHFLTAVARLAPGAALERVVADVKLLGARLSAADSGGSGGRQRIVAEQAGPGRGPPAPSASGRSILDSGFDVQLLREAAIGDVSQRLLILAGAVALVLLIACANAANLLLARATARRRELAVRRALLVGAGLLVRSIIRLTNVNPGFDTRDVLAARIRLTPARFPSGAQQKLFFEDMLAAVESHAGVQSASLASTLPLSGQMFMVVFDPRTVRPDYPEPIMVLRSSSVSRSYFTTFRIPIQRGRGFTVEDRAGAPSVAIINRTTADQLWPGQDPIGKQPTIRGPGQPAGPVTIVGVIDNLRSASLDAAPQPEIYRPASQQSEMQEMWLVVRANNGRPIQLAGAIREAVRRGDPDQSIGEIVSLEQLIGRQTVARRFNTTLLTIFALLAVGLALVGIYGVTAYAVTQRTRELGIRMALGARGGDVVALLMKESLRRVAAGVGLGLVGAWGVTRALTAMLFEVTPRDAATFAATSLLLVAVALVATWVPARRATKVDPMVALRYE